MLDERRGACSTSDSVGRLRHPTTLRVHLLLRGTYLRALGEAKDLPLRLGRLVEREGAVFDFARAFVFSDHHSSAGRLALDEHQAGRDRAVGKRRLPVPSRTGNIIT